MATLYYKTVWISDVHLGGLDCQAELVGEFLETIEAESIYLIGDIIDLERLTEHWYWPESHTAVLCKLIAKARQGTKVIYIPGNHDQALRSLIGSYLGSSIPMVGHAIHETADGRRLLLIHGDQFDESLAPHPLLNSIGCGSYELVQVLTRRLNELRRRWGYSYWSLSAFFKSRLKNVLCYIDRFEQMAVREAMHWQVDGLVCGHIHRPNCKTINGILYCNDGDWVENCSALVEHPDGRLELLNWVEEREALYGSRFTQAKPIVAVGSKVS